MQWGTRFQRIVLYVFTALLLVTMSWEYERDVAASVVTEGVIPDESIRLRVLAHDDSAEEQWLKRQVRDAVVQEIHGWAREVHTVEEARKKMAASLGEIESLVRETIEASGMEHSFTVEFGDVQFPSKLYGSQFYPAGVYEALLITIGEGQGANWWCVLFPPLCFVDFGSGEAQQTDADDAAYSDGKAEEEAERKSMTSGLAADAEVDTDDAGGVEVRFFVIEVFNQLKSFFS